MRRLVPLVLLAAALVACKGGDSTTDVEFTISPTQADLLPGETLQLAVVGATRSVTWSSSNNAVATVVPATGFVTAVGRGTATISAVAGSVVRSATINVLAPPALQVPAEVLFDIIEGENDPAPEFIEIGNAGDGTLQGLTAGPPAHAPGEPAGWLTVQLAGTQLSLRARRGTLPVGEYHASVPVAATNAVNSPQSILVTFRIGRRPSIAVSRDPVEMSTTAAGTDVETVEITNEGSRTLGGLRVSVAYGGTATGWLQAELSGTTAPATLTLTANSGQLPLGTYVANAVLESSQPGVTPFLLRVALTVTPHPNLALSRTSASFNAVFGGSAPAAETVTVTNGGGGELTGLSVGPVQYGAGASGWLQASIAPTTAPATITLAANQGSLPMGSYSATVPVQSPVAPNSPRSVQVTMTVGPAPAITTTPQSVMFGTYRNGSIPSTQSVAIGSTGGTLPGLDYTIQYASGSGWLDATWQNDDTTTPATLRLRPNTATLARGTYDAVVRVTSSAPGVAPRDIAVRYTVSTFDVDIFPLFTASNPGTFPRLPCTQCHGQFGNATNAYSYLTANQGVLMCKITGGASCPSEMRMPTTSVNRVQAWLNAGAPR